MDNQIIQRQIEDLLRHLILAIGDLNQTQSVFEDDELARKKVKEALNTIRDYVINLKNDSESCHWKHLGNGKHKTQCGEYICFENEPDLMDNAYQFCPFCGLRIEVTTIQMKR